MLCSSLLLPQPPDNDVCSGFLIENLDSDRKNYSVGLFKGLSLQQVGNKI